MIREGRIRRASLINWRRVISPSPCKFAPLVCICMRSGTRGCNSKTSSIVITRCVRGVSEISALSRVVFPACVPPLTRIFSPSFTAKESCSAISAVMTPIAANSCRLFCFIKCLRILTAQCSAVISGMATCKRLPSGKRASTNGCERSKRRPLQISMRSTSCLTDSEVNTRLINWLLPARATKIL